MDNNSLVSSRAKRMILLHRYTGNAVTFYFYPMGSARIDGQAFRAAMENAYNSLGAQYGDLDVEVINSPRKKREKK